MERVRGTNNSTDALYQTLSASLGTVSTETTEADSVNTNETQSDFAALLSAYLAPNGGVSEVSEEELFAAVIRQRLNALKGEEVAAAYGEALETQKSALCRADGFIPYEEAAKNALKELRANGTLSSEEADKIYSEAFAAAQIDSNPDALWDNRGSVEDATKAVEAIQSAILLAERAVQSMESGSAALRTRSLDESAANMASSVMTSAVGVSADSSSVASVSTPNGTTMDGANNFLFKPISNNESKLAVLLPSALKGLIESLVLKDSNGNVIDEGRSTGYGETGEREKFSFSKQGGEYPKNITVEAVLSDGTTRVWQIPDPSQRYD